MLIKISNKQIELEPHDPSKNRKFTGELNDWYIHCSFMMTSFPYYWDDMTQTSGREIYEIYHKLCKFCKFNTENGGDCDLIDVGILNNKIIVGQEECCDFTWEQGEMICPICNKWIKHEVNHHESYYPEKREIICTSCHMKLIHSGKHLPRPKNFR